eukprot:sb/3468425/
MCTKAEVTDIDGLCKSDEADDFCQVKEECASIFYMQDNKAYNERACAVKSDPKAWKCADEEKQSACGIKFCNKDECTEYSSSIFLSFFIATLLCFFVSVLRELLRQHCCSHFDERVKLDQHHVFLLHVSYNIVPGRPCMGKGFMGPIPIPVWRRRPHLSALRIKWGMTPPYRPIPIYNMLVFNRPGGDVGGDIGDIDTWGIALGGYVVKGCIDTVLQYYVILCICMAPPTRSERTENQMGYGAAIQVILTSFSPGRVVKM